MARLRDIYKSKIVPELTKEFNYKNPMAVPKMEKIIISMGLGRSIQDKKFMEFAKKDLTQIAGQKPVVCKAKKSVSNFKVREGYETGLKVTVCGEMMYEFFDRLVNVALARVRDFRGLSSKAFDGRGNYNLGISEQIIFPEIDYDKFQKTQGMDIAVTTSTNSDEQAFELLRLMGMPFKK